MQRSADDAMEQQVQEMAAAIQRLQATVTQQAQELAAARVAAAGQAPGAAASAAPREPARSRLVDTRGVGRPAVFDGTAAKWGGWSFRMENFIASVYESGRQAMEWAATREEVIDIALEGDLVGMIDVEEIDRGMYALLAQTTDGEAMDIVRNTIPRSGLEVWRKLNKRYDPQTVGRKRALLSRILNPGVSKLSELSAAIEQWEARVRVYTSRAGAERSIPDDVRTGILIEMTPDVLKQHLYLNQNRLDDYDKVRSEIATYLESRHGKEAIEKDGGPQPMDVGAMTKGKGKGNASPTCWRCGMPGHRAGECTNKGGGKGGPKGRGGPHGKGKGTKGAGKGVVCHKCGKMGHYARDCRSGGPGPGGGGAISAGAAAGQNGQSGHDKGEAKFEGYCGKCGRWGHRQRDCRKGINAMESENNEHVELTQGSLTIGAMVCSTADEVVINGVSYPAQLERLEAMVDSGAAVSAIPPEVASQYPVRNHAASGRTYYAANGTQVKDEGMRSPLMRTDEGQMRSVDFSVCNVRRPIISVGKAIEKGQRVVFDSDGSYVEDKASGARTAIEKKNGVFVMRMWVVPRPVRDSEKINLAPFSEGGATGSNHPLWGQAYRP